MADRHANRDLRGRFVSTRNTPESGDGKFETYTEMPVEIEGADPADLAYKTVGRDQNNAARQFDAPGVRDDLAVGGSPLRAWRPEMVSAEDAAHEVYGVQSAVLRAAARGSGPMDPARYLTGGE